MQDIDLEAIQEEVKQSYLKPSTPKSVKALADYNRDQNDLRVGVK